MNSRHSEGNSVRAAKRFLGLAGLVCLVLVCAGATWAQSKPAQTEPTAALPVATAPVASAGVLSSAVTPAAKQVVAQNSLAQAPAPKGQHEGITVHGHWTIEVKNPDGKVVTHREFENSLITPSNYPGANETGSQALVALLSGVGTLAPANSGYAAWEIVLFPATTSPCGTGENVIGSAGVIGISGIVSAGCSINPAAIISPTSGATIGSRNINTNIESTTLPTQFTISGSVQALQQGDIGAVLTAIALNPGDIVFPFSAAALPPSVLGQCGGQNQPTCTVITVAALQTITATVTYSFQ
jgi:hypothetical protein